MLVYIMSIPGGMIAIRYKKAVFRSDYPLSAWCFDLDGYLGLTLV
jgi:hypothetical protein